MEQRYLNKIITLVSCAFFVIFISLPIYASPDFGRITHDKIKSFSSYFEPYLKHDPPYFPNDERKEKIIAEANEIFSWLDTQRNWPGAEKITALMKADAARLFLYLSRAGIEKASKKAEEFALEGVKEVDETYESQIAASLSLIEVGGPSSLEAAYAAEKAISLDRNRAEKDNAYYYAAIGYYSVGYFRKGYEYIQKQCEVNPGFRDSENLLFILQSRIDMWGEIPERVVFQKNENGDIVPIRME